MVVARVAVVAAMAGAVMAEVAAMVVAVIAEVMDSCMIAVAPNSAHRVQALKETPRKLTAHPSTQVSSSSQCMHPPTRYAICPTRAHRMCCCWVRYMRYRL